MIDRSHHHSVSESVRGSRKELSKPWQPVLNVPSGVDKVDYNLLNRCRMWVVDVSRRSGTEQLVGHHGELGVLEVISVQDITLIRIKSRLHHIQGFLLQQLEEEKVGEGPQTNACLERGLSGLTGSVDVKDCSV